MIKRAFLLCFATIMLACAQGVQAQVEMPLPESHWAYEDMASLANKGLIPGYSSADFNMSKSYTREDMARIISVILDHFTAARIDFTQDDIAAIEVLIKEFESELQRAGELRRPAAAKIQDDIVPLHHWAYAAFVDFARKGFLPGSPVYLFQGTRIFTRTEMARLTQQLLAAQQQDPQAFLAEDLENLEYLTMEFRPELEGLGEPAPAQASRMRSERQAPPLLISGSNNLSVGVAKGDKSNVTCRLTFEAKNNHFESYFSGTMDNSDKQGTDLDFGRTYGLDISRKLIGFHTDRMTPGMDSYLLAGNINNLDFSTGLAVGATSIKGFMGSQALSPSARITAVAGDDSSGQPFLAFRVTQQNQDNSILGLTAVKEMSAANQSVRAISIDFAKKTPARRSTIEYTAVQSAGFGFYAEHQRKLNPDTSIQLEFRKYRDFILAHNNPSNYLGRSGGDDENEKSIYAKMDWSPGHKWIFSLSRDHLYSPVRGRRTNVFFGQQYKPSDIITLAWGWEKERGADAAERERSSKLRYKGFRDYTLSVGWKRSIRQSGPSSTTRFDIAKPSLGVLGKSNFSYTRRKTLAQRTNSYRMRFTRPLGPVDSASLSYDYSPSDASKMDMNMSWKY